MELDKQLVKQFVEITNDTEQSNAKPTSCYGTVVVNNSGIFVRLDGSTILTPVSMATDAKDGDRVIVTIEDHSANISNNITSPASGRGASDLLREEAQEDGTVVIKGELRVAKEYVDELAARKITVDDIEASSGYIKDLKAENITTDDIKASTGYIGDLKTENVTAGDIKASTGYIKDLETKQITTDDIQASTGYIGELKSENITTDDIKASTGYIDELTTDGITTDKLKAASGYIDDLKAKDITADSIAADSAAIGELETDNAVIKETLRVQGEAIVDKLDADSAVIKELQAKDVSIDGELTAIKSNIQDLDVKKLDVESADLKYANIDFSNIGTAAIEQFYATSGIIKDLVIGDQTITGKLVGVTINGDLIEGNTVKADKLVVLGEDGLYYKLNVNSLGETTVSKDPEKYQNGLDGSAIIANSITAEKISVKDLVAFGATIGGFKIGDDSLYSGAKASVDNTTRGIYMDNRGQLAVGDDGNFLKFYIDENGDYKLEIRASKVIFGKANKSVEEVIDSIQEEMTTIKDEVTTLLRIESSRGTVFKNDSVSTVLSVVIYRGSQRITDMETLRAAMGSSVYLQWKWQRLDEESFGVIMSSDTRIGNDGFTFTLSPEDVDTKVTFMCELIE